MPDVKNVYFRVRKNVGLFDATNSYGRLFAKGNDAIDLLHRMSTNEMKPLEEAKSQAVLTALLNEKGRFIDVLKVVRDCNGHVMLIASKGSEESIIRWLDKFTIMEDARFVPATFPQKVTVSSCGYWIFLIKVFYRIKDART